MRIKVLIICVIFLASVVGTVIYQRHHQAQAEANQRAASAIIMGGSCAEPCLVPSKDIPEDQLKKK